MGLQLHPSTARQTAEAKAVHPTLAASVEGANKDQKEDVTDQKGDAIDDRVFKAFVSQFATETWSSEEDTIYDKDKEEQDVTEKKDKPDLETRVTNLEDAIHEVRWMLRYVKTPSGKYNRRQFHEALGRLSTLVARDDD